MITDGYFEVAAALPVDDENDESVDGRFHCFGHTKKKQGALGVDAAGESPHSAAGSKAQFDNDPFKSLVPR